MLKQMTSLLLVLAMVLTMLPISAFAEESAPAETQAQETVAETAAPEKSDFPPENTVVAEPVLPESEFDGTEEAAAQTQNTITNQHNNSAVGSGECGEGVTWVFDSDGTLTISGTGVISDYAYGEAPWHVLYFELHEIVVEEGITSIGKYAFSDTYASVVSLPQSLISIGENAFNDSFVKTIELPEGLESIGYNAFADCSALESVTFPSTLTTIGTWAFSRCTALETVVLPDSLTSAGSNLFYECDNLTSITFGAGLSEIPTMICYGCDKLEMLTISEGTTSVGQQAFQGCVSLADITFASTVQYIGSEAFSGCTALTTLSLPSGLTGISAEAFEDCCALTGVAFPSAMTSIGRGAFDNCTSLEYVSIPASLNALSSGYGSSPQDVFSNCTNLTYIDVAEDNQNYCDVDGILFSKDMATLHLYPAGKPEYSYIVPEGVTNLSGAFEDCRYLTELTLPQSMTVISGLGNSASLTIIHIPYGAKTVANDAFVNCTAMKQVDLPTSIEAIIPGCFAGCTSLESIAWPVDFVGTSTFEGCTSLKEITFLNPNLQGFGPYAFRDCISLEEITLPAGFYTYDPSCFQGCISLKNIYVVPENPYCYSMDGVLFSRSRESLILYPPGKTDAEYTVPDGIVSIENSSFEESQCERITVPDGVYDICSYAFCNSAKLISIVLPETLTAIDYYAFNGCTELADVYFRGTEEQWAQISIDSGNEPLNNAIMHYRGIMDSGSCGKTLRWDIYEGTLTIRGTGPMENYEEPEDVPWISVRSKIENVVIQEGVTTVGKNAFAECENLKTVTLEDGVTTIETIAFTCSGKLERLTIPSSLRSVGALAFMGCVSLFEVIYEGDRNEYQQLEIDPWGNSYLLDARVIITGFCDYLNNDDITINGSGSAYAYYAGTQNVTVHYQVNGVSGTVLSDGDGIFAIPLGTFDSPGEYYIPIKILQLDSRVLPDPVSLDAHVTVTSLEFSQTWKASLSAAASAALTAGVDGEFKDIAAEATLGKASIKGGVGRALSISSSRSEDGETLTLISEGELNGKAGIQSGITGELLQTEFSLEEGHAGVNGVLTGQYGLRIDEFSPQDDLQKKAIGTFFLGEVLLAYPNTLMLKALYDYMANDTYTFGASAIIGGTGIGVGAEAGANLGKVTINGEHVFSAAGANGEVSFAVDVQNTDFGESTKRTSYKTKTDLINWVEGRAYVNDVEFVEGIGRQFMGKDIEVVREKKNGKSTLEATFLDASQTKAGYNTLGTVVKSNYSQYIFKNAALEALTSRYSHYSSFVNKKRPFVSTGDLADMAEFITYTSTPVAYNQQIKENTLYSLPVDVGGGLGLSFGLDIELSYLEDTSYTNATGYAADNKHWIQGQSDDLSRYVSLNKRTLKDVFDLGLASLCEVAKSVYELYFGPVQDGAGGFWSWIEGKMDSANDWDVSITYPKGNGGGGGWRQSYQVDSLRLVNPAALDSGITGTAGNYRESKASTIGRPFMVTVTDNATGTEIMDFSEEPLVFTIRYAAEDLEAAGLSIYSPVVQENGIAIYRYSDNGDFFEYVGGINDLEAMTVTAEITKPGQYVLAADGCAPALRNLDLSDFGETPTITALVDDLTGLDLSRFVFALDGEIKVDSADAADHYDFETGIFTYTVSESEALSEGEHSVSFTLADTSRNIETYTYYFSVDLTAPDISNLTVTGHTNDGSVVEVRASVSDENLTNVYAVFSKLLPDGSWSEEVTAFMGNMGDGIWGLDYIGEGSSVRIRVEAADINGNTAQSDPFEAHPTAESVAISQEYIALYAGQQSPLQAEARPSELTGAVKWHSENESVAVVSEEGVVTANNVGTTYVVATVNDGEKELTARCRVDVAEAIELDGVQLSTTKLTAELFSTDYAEFDLLLQLPQNMNFQSVGESVTPESSSVAIEDVRFETEELNQYFDLVALDDRRIAVVPTDYAIGDPDTVAKSYKSKVIVTVQGTDYPTETMTLTVKKSTPKLKAKINPFNSFYSYQAQPITITGGTVTGITLNPDKTQPGWLKLQGQTLSLTEEAPTKSSSAKVYLLVETEEWRIPTAVTLTVKNTYKAPGLKLSASSVKMTADAANSSGIALKLLPKNKKDSLAALNVTGIASQTAGYTVTSFDAATGAFILKTDSGFVPGKVTLNVSFSDTDEILPLAVKVAVQTVSLKLSAKAVTLNTAVEDSAQVKLTAAPADYVITAPTITGNEAGIFDLVCENGTLTVRPTDAAEAGKTYTLSVSAGSSKPVKLTVKTVDAAPTVTLKAKGTVDLSFPEKAATVTAAFKNYASGAIADYTATVTAPDGSKSDAFTVKYDGTVFAVTSSSTDIATGTYKLTLKLILPDGTEVENTVKLTVKRTAVKLKLAPAKLTLNSTIADKANVAVTCSTKGYDFSKPIWELKAKNGKDSAEGALDIAWNNDKLEIAVNGSTEPGATYKLLVNANAYAPASTLTITIPTEAKSVIKSSLKAKGAIDVIRAGTAVTITPSYKNASAAGEETLNIYSSADNYAEPVNDLFNIAKDDQGRYILTAAKGLDHSKTYKAQLVTEFEGIEPVESALTKFTVKMGSAKLTLKTDGNVLFGNDCRSRIGFAFSAKDAALNDIQEVTIKADKKGYDQMLEVIDLGNGEFAIGFRDETVDRSLLGKTITVTLNVKLTGNETSKVNATAKLKLTVLS